MTYDYIVVGGGSAGCTVTGRLAMARAGRILLIESGGTDRNPLIHIPAGFTKLLGTRLLRRYKTEKQAGLDGRERILPQGHVLGGGSSVNAAIYIRGQRGDYDGWAEDGADGWSYRDVLPYFMRAEDNDRLANEFHGTGGPLGVSDLRQITDMSRAFVRACQQKGIPFTPDFNGARQRGVGFNQTTTRNVRRCSAAVAYLRPAQKTGLVDVETDATVTRILVEGDKAVGVEYRQNGQLKSARCEREVIVSAGAVETPKLLMLSGIGPEAQLAQHGIPLKAKLEGVGQNLQDHLEFPAVRYCTGPHGYYGHDNWAGTVKHGLQYVLFKTGPVASNVSEACCFVNVDDLAAEPNVQFHFVPIVFFDLDRELVKRAGATVNPCVLRPKSRGEIRLRSTDPEAPPLIDPRYLTDPEDVRMSIAGLRLAREVLSAPAFDAYVERTEAFPGQALQTAADLETYIRDRGKTVYHPVGTCRMGQDDRAVVDPQLRVRGLRNLRVVDNSVMPRLISGNTNATAIMIGEKASDMIRGIDPLRAAAV